MRKVFTQFVFLILVLCQVEGSHANKPGSPAHPDSKGSGKHSSAHTTSVTFAEIKGWIQTVIKGINNDPTYSSAKAELNSGKVPNVKNALLLALALDTLFGEVDARTTDNDVFKKKVRCKNVIPNMEHFQKGFTTELLKVIGTFIMGENLLSQRSYFENFVFKCNIHHFIVRGIGNKSFKMNTDVYNTVKNGITGIKDYNSFSTYYAQLAPQMNAAYQGMMKKASVLKGLFWFKDHKTIQELVKDVSTIFLLAYIARKKPDNVDIAMIEKCIAHYNPKKIPAECNAFLPAKSK